MRKRVGYAKLGRSMELRLNKCTSLGGDNEMVPTLKLLAERHPDVDFVLVGRNSGDNPDDVGLPKNVINPWIHWAPELRRRINYLGLNYANLSIEDHLKLRDMMLHMIHDTFQHLDELVMWIGQHGTSNVPLPSIKDRNQLTKPYDWANLYAGYLLTAINSWRARNPLQYEPVLLNADARNYPKFRDMAHPLYFPVLGQYNQTNLMKHETGTEVIASPTETVYSRLEISSLVPGAPFGDTITFDNKWVGRRSFGVVMNETRRDVSLERSRRKIVQDWLFQIDTAFFHGVWSDKTVEEINNHWFRDHEDEFYPKPVPLLEYIPKLQTVHSTFTTPASGSGWATAKPWEAFAAGTVCFFHPAYDDQDNILSDAPNALRDFLRVSTPAELARRVKMVHEDPGTWGWAVNAQRIHFEKACSELTYLKLIEARLGL
jgi:hypothetical protein